MSYWHAALLILLSLAPLTRCQDFCPSRTLSLRNASAGDGLNNCLVLYLKADETSGQLQDATGNFNNESARASFSDNSTGIIGKAVVGSGTGVVNDYINFTNLAGAVSPLGPGYTGNFSGSFWYNHGAVGANTDVGPAFLGVWDSAPNSSFVLFAHLGAPANPDLAVYDGTTQVNVASGVPVAASGDSAWHHIAFGNDGSHAWIQIDGGARTQATANGTKQVSRPFVIGNYASHGSGVPGLYDEIALWSRSLSSAEVVGIYNAGLGKRPAVLTPNTLASCGAGQTCHNLPAPSVSPASGTHPQTLTMANNWTYNTIYFTVDGSTLPASPYTPSGGTWNGSTIDSQIYTYSGPISLTAAATIISVGSVGCGCPPNVCSEWYDSAYATNTFN